MERRVFKFLFNEVGVFHYLFREGVVSVGSGKPVAMKFEDIINALTD